MVGSSRTYNTPLKPEPIWEARRILWASPPDRLPASLSRVKYSRPTEIRNLSLCSISLMMSLATNLSLSLTSFWVFRELIHSSTLDTEKEVTADMDNPRRVTDRLSGLSLVPLQTTQICSRMYFSISPLT